MTMGSRITQLRNGKGYTQEYLAVQLGISRQAVHKWEKNESKPDTDNLILLAQILETTVDYLASGNSAEPKKKPKLPQAAVYVILVVVTAVITFMATVIYIANRPVSFDAGACGGGFETAVFDQYADSLVKNNWAYITHHIDEECADNLVVKPVRESRNVSYKDKAIYMSFDVEYLFADSSVQKATLHFVGERKWIQQYDWKIIN